LVNVQGKTRRTERETLKLFMERYIAIDNVCAWPCLNLAADGTLKATIFNQPNHGGCEGDTECWSSEDEGRSWQKLALLHPHTPGTNHGLNHSAGFSPDGTFIVITNGRSNRPPPGQIRSAKESEILPPLVCRSTDGGKTWKTDGAVEMSKDLSHPPVAFGPIVSLDGERIAAPLHSGGNVHLYESNDQGLTWLKKARIAPENYNETAIVVLRSGRLLAAARTYGDQHLDLFRSDDGGDTWQSHGPITTAGQIPGNLLQLRDGRVLLTYGVRNLGLRGLGYRWSEDEGQSWSRQGLLHNFDMITDGGYPSCVEMPDGTIVTAYYAGANPAHMRYHMGILRWSPEELKNPNAFGQSYAAGLEWKNHWAGSSKSNPGHLL